MRSHEKKISHQCSDPHQSDVDVIRWPSSWLFAGGGMSHEKSGRKSRDESPTHYVVRTQEKERGGRKGKGEGQGERRRRRRRRRRKKGERIAESGVRRWENLRLAV